MESFKYNKLLDIGDMCTGLFGTLGFEIIRFYFYNAKKLMQQTV